MRHWIVANVDGNIQFLFLTSTNNWRQGLKPATSFKDVSLLHQYTPYHGPTPPAGTGKHRYVFVLYLQPETNQTLLPILEDSNVHRAFFNITEFVATNQLTPIAASYMLAEHEDGYDGNYRKSHSMLSYQSMSVH